MQIPYFEIPFFWDSEQTLDFDRSFFRTNSRFSHFLRNCLDSELSPGRYHKLANGSGQLFKLVSQAAPGVRFAAILSFPTGEIPPEYFKVTTSHAAFADLILKIQGGAYEKN